MNIYRVLLVILIVTSYAVLFWVLPFTTGAAMVGVATLHGIAVVSAYLVFAFN